MSRPRLLEELRQQFAANPRLRLALPLIAALLAGFLWRELDTLRIDVSKTTRAEQGLLARMKALRGQDVWIERSSEVAAVRDALLAELPTAATPGLAQAAVQTELAVMARSLGSDRDARTSAEPVSDEALPSDVIRIRANLSGAMTPRQAMTLLQKIEGGANLAVIEALDIRTGANRITSLTYSAYYRLAPTTERAP